MSRFAPSNGAELPFGAEHAFPSKKARRLVDRLLEAMGKEARALAVRQHDAAWLRRFAESAAAPVIVRLEVNGGLLYAVDAPGANERNTEVAWDPARRVLLVAVWCGRPPAPREPLRLPLPEIAWFASFSLPHAAGARTEARVRRGSVLVFVPAWRGPATVHVPNISMTAPL